MKKRSPRQVIDFSKTHKELYSATRRVAEVNAGRAMYLAIEGQGPPGGGAFQEAIQCLYGITYTIKFTLKFDGVLDFTVGRLEALYLSDPGATPMAQWRWRFLVRVPEAVTARHLAAARKTLKERRGLDVCTVKRVQWKEGRALQVLHVGPYDKVGATYRELDAWATAHGLHVHGPAHEIYISDPRRVAPARLKTIVRLPARKA